MPATVERSSAGPPSPAGEPQRRSQFCADCWGEYDPAREDWCVGPMTNHLIGQTCALLAAITWAVAVVLFKRSGERVPPIALSLCKNTISLILLAATVAILILCDQIGFESLLSHSRGDICLLFLSGVVGIAIADTVFFYALNLIGVGLISVVDCAYAPCAILFAWLLLCEKLTVFHYLGAALIVFGVFIASRHALPPKRTRWQIVGGMLLAIAAVVMMTAAIVIVQPIIQDVGIIWTTTIRMAAGLGFLAFFALLGAWVADKLGDLPPLASLEGRHPRLSAGLVPGHGVLGDRLRVHLRLGRRRPQPDFGHLRGDLRGGLPQGALRPA